MMSYAELLRDPRWQRMRLEVLNRDEWRCRECGDATSTLNVHHRRYIKGHKPWEYDADELLTLCEPCHSRTHGIQPATPINPIPPHRRAKARSAFESLLLGRMREIDRLLPLATEEHRDALLAEKVRVAGALKHITNPRWISSMVTR